MRYTGVGSVLIQLLPLSIAAMAMPTWVLLVLLLLRARRRPTEAVAFVGGVTAVRLLQGAVFGGVLSAAVGPRRQSEWVVLVSALLLVTGVLMWAAAVRQMDQAVEPGGSPRSERWVALLDSLTPARAFGVGALLVGASSRAWLFTLAAIGVIGQAALTSVQSFIVFLLYVLGAELLLLASIVLSLWTPARFDAAAEWLEGHERPIAITVSLILGTFFLWAGIRGLAG